MPYLYFLSKKNKFLEIIPISAKTGKNIDLIKSIINKKLPESAHFFPKNYITNQSMNFIASEIIREKLMRLLRNELSYLISVKVEKLEINKYGNYIILGLIIVKSVRHKRILIGNKGTMIKNISIESRKDMQKKFNVRVYLKLLVKVKI